MRHLQTRGAAAVVAAVMMALGGPPPAVAAVTPRVPGKACERTYALKPAISDPVRPDTLTVTATGPSCDRARIVVTLRTASHRRLWTEQAFVSTVQYGHPPNEPGPEITFEAVIGLLENWVSVEPSATAPAWRDGAASLAQATASASPGATQYDSRLDRARYEAIRAAQGKMLCIPGGPESAHCIALDPTTRRLVEVLGRGI